jgi:hypothetical protein
VATSPARTDRWKALDFGPPPSDAEEPDLPVLVEYTQDERVAVITLNRPHAAFAPQGHIEGTSQSDALAHAIDIGSKPLRYRPQLT